MILFGLLYKKVSLKYHKCDRSIMKLASKYHQISIKASRNRHEASCIIAKSPTHQVPKFHPILWALDAHSTGNECPLLGLSMPITWSLSAHLTGTDRPLNGL